MIPSTLWKRTISVASVNALHQRTAISQLGIEFTEIGPDFMRARMPVDERTRQPYGLLHGGALVLLAETLASCAGVSSLPEDKLAVGIEVNANHLRSARNGMVSGVCRPIHLGRGTQVWQVEIVNDRDEACCVARLTLAVIDRKM